MRRPVATLLIGLIAVTLLAGACSVPTDETAQEIDSGELPEVLRSTSTTTSTLPPPLSETVTVFFLRNPEDGDQPVVVAREREVAAGSGAEAILEELFGASGPTKVTEAEQEEQLFNSLDEFALNSVGVEDSVATIDISFIDALTGEPDDAPIGTLLLNVAAQLVFSATEIDGIDAVLIERDGLARSLPTQSEGDSEVDEPVDREDYPRYDSTFTLDDAPPETSEAPPSSSTTTTTSTISSTTTTTLPA